MTPTIPLAAGNALATPLAVGHELHLVVRAVHVLAVTVLLGGAIMAWLVLRQFDRSREARSAREVAMAYEWSFWGAIGLLIMTGVGNLGAFGSALPDGGTAWGRTLTGKLGLALAFLLGSVVRTLAVTAWARRANGRTVPDGLRTGYAATAAVLVVLLALAEVLAHG